MAKKKEETVEETTDAAKTKKAVEEKSDAKTEEKKAGKAETSDKKEAKADAAEEASIAETIADAVVETAGDAADVVADTASDVVEKVTETASDVVEAVAGNDEEETTEKKSRKRAEKVGIVFSDKMTKTVVVRVNRMVKHQLYHKYMKKRKKFMAHDEMGAAVGDRVRIVETRPLSAKKRWRVVEIIQKAEK